MSVYCINECASFFASIHKRHGLTADRRCTRSSVDDFDVTLTAADVAAHSTHAEVRATVTGADRRQCLLHRHHGLLLTRLTDVTTSTDWTSSIIQRTDLSRLATDVGAGICHQSQQHNTRYATIRYNRIANWQTVLFCDLFVSRVLVSGRRDQRNHCLLIALTTSQDQQTAVDVIDRTLVEQDE